VCPEGIQKSNVLQVLGPFPSCSGPDVNIRPLYTIDGDIPITGMNLYWDHTCNVDILQPEDYPNGTLITTKQVSAYDSKIRPQANYEFIPKKCEDCWRKVNGLGALDFGIFSSAWTPEYNCGDSCIFYTLEEHLVAGEVKPPRALVGRSFRTDLLSFNITDSIQAQTFSFNPYVYYNAQQNQFLGIGICCTDQPWCHPDCANLNLNSHLVLISFMPNKKDQEFTILADIGDVFDPETVRIGVEYTPMFTASKQQAYVFYQESVISFDLVVNNGLIVSAKRSHQSPKINVEIVVWSTGRVD